MRRDISFDIVSNVTVCIVVSSTDLWDVYLLNRGDQRLVTVLITSRGYGSQNGSAQRTSLLRHSIPFIDARSYSKIDNISQNLFHLTNEYWVSYYIGNQIFDKKFIFVPDTIIEKNLTFIPELNAQGVLHD